MCANHWWDLLISAGVGLSVDEREKSPDLKIYYISETKRNERGNCFWQKRRIGDFDGWV